MASQWYRKAGDAEVGPLAFEDLVELILAGTLAEDDWVRREVSPEWIRARAVIGLFKAAEKRRSVPLADNAPSALPPETSAVPEMAAIPKTVAIPKTAATLATAAPRRRKFWWPKFKLPRLRYCLAGAAVVLLLCFGIRSWRSESTRRFPEHHMWGGKRAPPTHPMKVAWPKRPDRPPASAVGQQKPKTPPVAPLVTLLPGHGAVRSVAFAPDGRTLATAGDDGRARLWALDTLKCVRELGDHFGPINSVAFSPDGTRLALVGLDRRVTVWDARDGHRCAELKGHTGEVTGVKFSPDGKRLASSAYDSEVRVWDVDGAREVFKLKHLVFSQCIDWSPDGRLICATAQDGWGMANAHLVMLWNAETGQEIARLPGHRQHITLVRFSPDSKRLVTGASDSWLLLWDVATRKRVSSTLTNWGMPSAAFLPDGKTLAAATHSGRVSLRDLSTLGETVEYEGHYNSVVCGNYGWCIYSLAVSPDGSVVASTDRQGKVKFWPTFRGAPEKASAAATLQRVAAAAGPVTPPPASMPVSSELVYSVPLQRTGVLFAAFSPDGKVLAAGGEDGTIAFLEADKGRVGKTLKGGESAVLVGDFSPGGERLVAGSYDGAIRLWDIGSARQLQSIAGTASWSWVRAAAFAPDGKSFVAGNEAGFFRRWDTDTAREINKANLPGMTSLALSPDGQWLATANLDKTVGVWKLNDLKPVAVLKGHPDYVTSAAFSPDGRMLVSSSATFDPKSNVKLWDTATWKELAALEGHGGYVQCATFSPDGKTIATAGSDTTVRIWSAADGSPLKTLRGHTAAVVFVRFSPDGRRLVSAGLDGTMKVWNAARQ